MAGEKRRIIFIVYVNFFKDEYVLDLRKTWDLKNPEEANDVIPEIWNGKNVADFVDPDILEKLEALEKEEEEREKSGFYKLDAMQFDEDDMEIHELAKTIRRKRKINKLEAKLENKSIGRSKLTRKNKVRNFDELRVYFFIKLNSKI